MPLAPAFGLVPALACGRFSRSEEPSERRCDWRCTLRGRIRVEFSRVLFRPGFCGQVCLVLFAILAVESEDLQKVLDLSKS